MRMRRRVSFPGSGLGTHVREALLRTRTREYFGDGMRESGSRASGVCVPRLEPENESRRGFTLLELLLVLVILVVIAGFGIQAFTSTR